MESLYVAEFSGGLLKVGRSRSAGKRLAQHAANLRPSGAVLLRSEVFQCAASLRAEAELIRRCAERCESRSQNEWFRGVPFGEALEWAKEIAISMPEDGGDLPSFVCRSDSLPPQSGGPYCICRLCCRFFGYGEGDAFLCQACGSEGYTRAGGNYFDAAGAHVDLWSLGCGAAKWMKYPGVLCEELRPEVAWIRIPSLGWPLGKPLLDPSDTAA